MITINPTGPKKEDSSRIKSKRKFSHVNEKRQTFDITLNETLSFNFQGAIDELLNDLKEEEKSFLEKQTLYELNRYKAIIQKILKKIMDEGFETSKLKRLRRDKADFIIVKNINAKLFEIVTGITNKNNKAFNLLNTMEEIRGLVFDLLY